MLGRCLSQNVKNPKLLIVVLIFFPIFSKKLALKTILLTSLKTEKGIVLSGNYQLKFKPCKKGGMNQALLQHRVLVKDLCTCSEVICSVAQSVLFLLSSWYNYSLKHLI